MSAEEAQDCFLCGRPLGGKVERHHPVPKSRGGRETGPVHPICHRAIHRALSNKELEKGYSSAEARRAHPEIARFVEWVAGKDPDFHVPTRKPRG
jgi:hypothetical protein